MHNVLLWYFVGKFRIYDAYSVDSKLNIYHRKALDMFQLCERARDLNPRSTTAYIAYIFERRLQGFSFQLFYLSLPAVLSKCVNGR